ncbi:MAG: minor capsid protein [Mariprofundaceae bacterium]|nr:minor capsid protein [Mariprofundaceae bacterium]
MTVQLTDSVLNDVGTHLQTSGIGTLGVDVFLYQLPHQPTEAVAVIPTGGPRLAADLNAIKRVQFQVLIRADSITSGMQKAEKVFSALDNQANVLANNPGRIFGDHEPGVHFRDANNRVVFSLNFTTTLLRETS